MEEKENLRWGMVFRQTSSEVFRIFKKRIREQAPVQLTIDQYALLLSLNKQEDEVIQKNMAEAMGKKQSALIKLIDSLEKKKLIKRIVDTNDRRKNILTITKKGEHIMKQYMEIESVLICELQQEIPQAELDNFHRIVSLIQAKAKKM
ncbi:MAG: MarR family winged helix-turn-helix transcriptional regulator [Mangrovibacterium sp.]